MPLLRHVAKMYRSPRRVEELADRLGITSFANIGIRRLSGGQKQRLALAAALVGNPEVLFLDEPSAGLDPQSRQVVFDLIVEERAKGLGIILTTHLMEDAQRLADYVYIIDAGKTVAQGTVSELTSRTAQGTPRELIFEARQGLTFEVPLGMTLTEITPGRYTVTGITTTAQLTLLTSAWQSANVLPHSISMIPRSLEDVFLDLSGRTVS